jgi:hypothetical protein
MLLRVEMMKRIRVSALVWVLALCWATMPAHARKGNNAGLKGKVLVGYQGWFRCPGDGSPKDAWSHWSKGAPSAETTSIDLFPDTSELSPRSRCALPGMTIDGKQAYVFSSFPKETVQKHFEWMRTYQIDGALLQRFIGSIEPQHEEGDVVLKSVRESAEATGRVFAVEYDLSGAHPDTALKQLQDDWQYMTNELKITSSPAYLRDHGRPVVAIWGLGFNDRSHLQDPALCLQIVNWFKNTAHVTVMGGVPAGWGTLSADSSRDKGWDAVYAALDIVQPWTVGRYKTLEAADAWKTTHLIPDLALTKKHGQEYMPVIFPGFSWHNLNRNTAENQIPRLGGAFLWRQAYNAKTAGASFVKIAMFDEVNEGTAIFKAAATRKDAPAQGYWLTLDADGLTLPNDWYLQLARDISKMFRGTMKVTPETPKPPPASQP